MQTCGTSPSWWCERALDLTNSATAAEVVDWVTHPAENPADRRVGMAGQPDRTSPGDPSRRAGAVGRAGGHT